jgi:RND family efflux transporter MFP subunit
VALKPFVLVACLCVVAPACGRSDLPAPVEEEREGLSVTRWTAKTELFAEYPALVVNETSRFAIHLTRLDTFKAMTEGQVEVQLRGTGQPEVFRTDGPSRPGIFGVDVKPSQPGKRQLVIVLKSKDVSDEHQVGGVDVHATTDAAKAAAGGEAGEEGISFLKEQQWTLDFATALVREQAIRESLRVPARLEARPDGAADVVAPIDGRLTRVLDLPLGASVSRGQELARLLPPPSVPGDLPQLQRARTEAQTALALAIRDRERAERLTAAGAAPEKRLDEARSMEEQAKARLAAAEASLAQYNVAREGGGGEGLFVARAPLGGVVAARSAATGATVAAGAVLFRIVDAAQVHVVGQVPEADAAKVRDISAAELEIPGRADRVAAGRLASVGKVLDPQSRTLPITFAFDNRALALPVGQSVFLHLLTSTAAARPVVPAVAVVDDGGRPIVFVQREGETFERRAVTTGARAGDLVQIVDGVKTGERVVTRGAYLVRLASLSTTVPAHGHVH